MGERDGDWARGIVRGWHKKYMAEESKGRGKERQGRRSLANYHARARRDDEIDGDLDRC